ncbi:hypothetical protein A9G11_09915 [Gilliamella sp. wkB108]|uniref:hypothetical protein n=1 Tax=Gilliamella sp. wkB108 TaxID=3120256 RepID=UPI00080DC08F|nr:hypothetical protein [Gilliamella apicola]OCG19529.1 hypothetical protein A9G11_09915 [Gilliamella apicola]
MNNYILGYLSGINYNNSKSILKKIAIKYGIGLKEILPEQLFQFTDRYLPNKNDNNFIFSMSDCPDCEEADYLIDYLNYDPEMQSKFPPLGIDRLQILISILKDMIIQTKCSKLVISLTDSGYIYSYKVIKFDELSKTLLSDFELNQGAPDTLYEIIC